MVMLFFTIITILIDRQGSIIVVFTLVFYSTYLPADTAVRKVFTDNATPTTTGALTVTVGLYAIPYAESTIVVGSVTIIDIDKNPTPSKSFCSTKRTANIYTCLVKLQCDQIVLLIVVIVVRDPLLKRIYRLSPVYDDFRNINETQTPIYIKQI